MALSDGDPRLAAPELYRRLSRLEQRYAVRAFEQRLGLAGRNDPQYPDDEPPLLVAGHAIRASAYRLVQRIAQGAWGVFALLALATIAWPGLKGHFMLAMLLTALGVTGLGLVWAGWRGRQVRRWVASLPPMPESASTTEVMPVVDGRLGPEQLAPVLMGRLSGLERQLVLAFFPGAGAVSTGTPDWNGSPHDRLRLRRCLIWVEVGLLVIVTFLGSLMADALLSLAIRTANGNLTGVFVVGWFAGAVWFVHRMRQIRRWYRAGIGHEAELARRARAEPAPEGRVVPSAVQKRAVAALTIAVPLFIAGLGVWGIFSELGDRAATHPYAGGVTTTGVVVKVLVNDGRSTTYRAVSTFTDMSGRTRTVVGQSGEERPYVGEKVGVSYQASDPENARELTTNVNAWKFPFGTFVFITAIGILGLTFTGAQLLRYRAMRQPDGARVGRP